MKRTFLALGLAFALGFTASVEAQTPKEVAEPYKAYRAALAADQKQEAAEYAYEAWQEAEDLMGDTATTGDLANNFADLAPSFLDDKAAWQKVVNAHKRAIDLAALHDADPQRLEVDRRANYLRWLISNVSTDVKSVWRRGYGVKQLKEKIEEYGLSGSTFDAEATAFGAQIAMRDKNWKKTERESKVAMAKFDARDDGLFSIYEFAVPIYLARSYAERDQPIDAALTYQNLMTKMEKTGGHKNKISGDAYAEWLRLRDEIAQMDTQDPRVVEVVSFTVPSGRQEELAPLVRKPPVLPASFFRGNNSGFVKVKFNIDIEGRVINPVIISSTKESLHKATLKSLEGWRYTPNLPEARSQDIKTTIRFNLQDSLGRRLPDGVEKSRL